MGSNCCQTFIFKELSLLSFKLLSPPGGGTLIWKGRGVHVRNFKKNPQKFPASRSLSWQDKLKREASAGFRRVPYHACPRVSLTTSDVFVTWHNLENRFEFERKRERLFNLSARSNFKWTNQSWRWNDLGCCRGPHYKSLREAEEANFKANFSFFTSLSTGKAHVFGSWSEIYWALWNCWFYCDSGLFFFEEKAICGVTSGQRWMEWFLC